MKDWKLHRSQVAVLRRLRRGNNARYTDLKNVTTLESDTFKFHLRKLIKLEMVYKNPEGIYDLTDSGKEFANTLDESSRSTNKQPKLSVLLVVETTDQDGKRFFLSQKRTRNPFFGYHGFLSGPIRWGELAEETAARELLKQTDIDATFEVDSFRRVRDYGQDTNTLLEDKLFTILRAKVDFVELNNSWAGGVNNWMSAEELCKQEKLFFITREILNDLTKNKRFETLNNTYSTAAY